MGTIIKFMYDLYNIICELKDSMDLRYGYIMSDNQEKIYSKVKIDESENNDCIIEDILIPSGKNERVIRSLALDKYVREENLVLEESKNI